MSAGLILAGQSTVKPHHVHVRPQTDHSLVLVKGVQYQIGVSVRAPQFNPVLAVLSTHGCVTDASEPQLLLPKLLGPLLIVYWNSDERNAYAVRHETCCRLDRSLVAHGQICCELFQQGRMTANVYHTFRIDVDMLLNHKGEAYEIQQV